MVHVDKNSRCVADTLGASETRKQQASTIATGSIAVWLSSYYLLTQTFFDRISLGGLIMESVNRYPTWLQIIATISLGLVALSALAIRDKPLQPSSHPRVWLLTLCLWVPIMITYLRSVRHDPSDGALESIIIATSVGAVSACIAMGSGKVIWVMALIGFIQSVYAIIYQHGLLHGMLSGTIYRAGGTFGDPNALYTLMLVALPFSLVGAISASNAVVKILYLVASAAEFATLLLSLSRGGILGVGASVVVLAYFLTKSKRVTVTVLAGALALALLVNLERASGPANIASVTRSNISRLAMMKSGWTTFVHHPIAGAGIDSFRASWSTRRGESEIHNVVNDPKNLYLYWLAERGIVGGLLFVLFAWTIYVLVRRSLVSPLAISTGAAWIGLLVAGLVDTPFGPSDRYVGNYCFGFLLGCSVWLQVGLNPSDETNS